MMNLTSLIHMNATNQPDAVMFSDARSSTTYSEFSERVARTASALKNVGVEKNTRVALLALNSSRYIECIFAVLWAGGVISPVNIRWSLSEISYSLEDCGASILLVDDSFEHLAPGLLSSVTTLSHALSIGEAPGQFGVESLEEQVSIAAPIPEMEKDANELAGILYTGGTTGRAKGVMLTHANLMTFPATLCLMTSIPQKPNTLMCAPLFHIAGLGMLLSSMMRGGNHVCMSAFDPTHVIEAIHRFEITETLLVPTMLQMLLDSPAWDDQKFRSLRKIVYGASPMPDGTIDLALQKLAHVEFVQGYGMTECGLITVSSPCYHNKEAIASGLVKSAGKCGPFQQAKIVDPEGLEITDGRVGEIWMRGSGVMQGYWNKRKETDAALKNGWLRTGDGGRMDEDGNLFVVDRVKDMIISGGENIYSAEVEAIISLHPKVSQCAVIGVPSPDWGEVVHVVVVPNLQKPNSNPPELSELSEFCRGKLAGYKIPRSLQLVEQLPLSGAGKVLKTKLRAPFWSN